MGAQLERLQDSLDTLSYKRSLEDSVGVEATNSGEAAAERNISCSTACERPVSGSVAQESERFAYNEDAGGANPSAPTTHNILAFGLRLEHSRRSVPRHT